MKKSHDDLFRLIEMNLIETMALRIELRELRRELHRALGIMPEGLADGRALADKAFTDAIRPDPKPKGDTDAAAPAADEPAKPLH